MKAKAVGGTKKILLEEYVEDEDSAISDEVEDT